MGSKQAKTRSKKGVVYSEENNEVIDCLFCRIVRGESPVNQLWYKDDQCVVFIPRGPAARLHLLVVPLQHIQNVSSLTEEHRLLLEHMKKVIRRRDLFSDF
jgi:diadenosine tetraphosphate (Ap4A) HIT family hydrolase